MADGNTHHPVPTLATAQEIMSCQHTFADMRWHRAGQRMYQGGGGAPQPSRAECTCGRQLAAPGIPAAEFLQMRRLQFENETHKDSSVYRDMFYRPLVFGSQIVYPSGYGSSSFQLTHAEILAFDMGDPPGYGTDVDETRAQLRHGEPYKLKLQPLGYESRAWYWRRHNDDEPMRKVTITSTAGSAVLVDL